MFKFKEIQKTDHVSFFSHYGTKFDKTNCNDIKEFDIMRESLLKNLGKYEDKFSDKFTYTLCAQIVWNSGLTCRCKLMALEHFDLHKYLPKRMEEEVKQFLKKEVEKESENMVHNEVECSVCSDNKCIIL